MIFMKRAIVFILIAMIILSPVVLARSNFILKKEVIISFKDDIDPQIIEKYEGLIREKFKSFRGISALLDNYGISELSKTPGIKIHENKKFNLLLSDSVPMIGADKVHAEGITGGIRICIIDTGIDYNHLSLNINPNDETQCYHSLNSGADVGLGCMDDHSHGTHVAGIIASTDGTYRGVSPGAILMMAKVFKQYPDGYYAEEIDVLNAIDWCVENGAKVISMSLGANYGGDCDQEPMGYALNNAESQGVVSVVAAGNDGSDVDLPACASGPIAVGAVDKSKNVPYWSSRGPEVDIVAPGVSITSAKLNGGWVSKSGTSMATPHVSGVVSLLLDANPSLGTSEIKQTLYGTASPVNKCYGCGFVWGSYCFMQREVACTPGIIGAGIVNAYDAYLSVKSVEPECSTNADCDDGLYCNGAEACVGGVCYNGTPVDCSSNNLPEIATCDNDTDNNPFTWDYAFGFISECDESNDKCTGGSYQYTHTCDVTNCGAECDSSNQCTDTDCDYLDGCVGNDYYDYTDMTNDCLSDCSCENNVCGDYTVYPNDIRCVGCMNDEDCNFLDNDYCNGDMIMHDEGRCIDYECTKETSTSYDCNNDNYDYCDGTQIKHADHMCDSASCVVDTTATIQECDNELYCDGQESCVDATCVAGSPVNCNDNSECTTDSCNEDIDTCEYVWPGCGSSDGCCGPGCNGIVNDPNYDPDCETTVKCWSGDYQYLYRNRDQMNKFCKCAMGTYGYNSYTYSFRKKTVYYYLDPGNNDNWSVTSRLSYLPVHGVTCPDGIFYQANQDYYK